MQKGEDGCRVPSVGQQLNNVGTSSPSANSSGAGGTHRLAQTKEEQGEIGGGHRALMPVRDSGKEGSKEEESPGNLKAASRPDMLLRPNRPEVEASNNPRKIKENAKASQRARTKVKAKVLRMSIASDVTSSDCCSTACSNGMIVGFSDQRTNDDDNDLLVGFVNRRRCESPY